MKTILRISFVIVLICLFVIPVQAQDKETPYWEITQYHVDKTKIDSLKTLEGEYYTKIVKQAKKMGLIMDSVLLIMQVGDTEYNVIVVDKCASWDKLNFKWDEAFKIIEPDKKIRDEVYAAYRWFFEGKDSKSAIYYAAADYD